MRKKIKKVIWFTGLSGSGKSTLSKRLVNYLEGKKYSCIILDGDEIRAGLCSDLKFIYDILSPFLNFGFQIGLLG